MWRIFHQVNRKYDEDDKVKMRGNLKGSIVTFLSLNIWLQMVCQFERTSVVFFHKKKIKKMTSSSEFWIKQTLICLAKFWALDAKYRS